MNDLRPAAVADVGFDLLAAHWRLSRLIVRAPRPVDLEVDFALPARLRGALGHALLARRADAEWDSARRILFEPVAWRARALLPKPFVIASEEDAGLRIELTLFGTADRWRRPIFDAFLEALASGIALSGRHGSLRRPILVSSADWTRSESIPVPVATRRARLLFRTPLRLGGGRALGLRWSDVVVSLAERAAGLAMWQGLRVNPELGCWRKLGECLGFRDADMWPVAWERRSGAQAGRSIPMAGLMGPLEIENPPELLMPLLALGESMHVGGAASLGLGRYHLI